MTECVNCGEAWESTDLVTVDWEPGPICIRCRAAALAHGHGHGLHVDEDGRPTTVEHCPSCPDRAAEETWVLRRVEELLRDRGWSATVEYPGFLLVRLADGLTASFGTANGETWGGHADTEDGANVDGVSPLRDANGVALDAESMDVARIVDAIDTALRVWADGGEVDYRCPFCFSGAHEDVRDCPNIDIAQLAAALGVTVEAAAALDHERDMLRAEVAATPTTAPGRVMTDTAALDAIAAAMNAREWHAETLDEIAAIIRDTGRTVEDCGLDADEED